MEAKRIWTEEEIKQNIQENDRWLYKALIRLYDCQTSDEQKDRTTTHRNGKGFNSVDAKFMSSISQFLLKTGYLTDKQKVCARKRMVKYTKQLTAIANA